MANIRCPNCGKDTPSNEELCQFCFSRLKPLGAVPPSSSDDLMSLLNSQDDDDVPDWMRSLRPEDETPSGADLSGLPADWLPEQLAGQPAEQDDQDWLAGLGKLGELPAQGESTAPFADDAVGDASAADLDWLADLDAESQSGAQEPLPDFSLPEDQSAEPGEAGSMEDWLSNLGSPDQLGAKEPLPDFSLPEDRPAEPGEAGSLDDWLSSLSSADQPENSQAVPDLSFLSKAGSETSSQQETEDWLASLGESKPSEPEELFAEAEAPEAIGSGTEDWLASLGVSDESGPDFGKSDEQTGEVSWSAEETLAGDFLQSEAGSFAGNAEPGDDWLSRLGDAGVIETGQGDESAASQLPEQIDEFDWLKPISSEPGAELEWDSQDLTLGPLENAADETLISSPPGQTDANAEMADWLARLGTQDVVSSAESTSEASQPEESGDHAFEWMSSLETPLGQEAGAPSSEEWLSELPEPESQAAALPGEAGLEQPDWLSRLGEETVSESEDLAGALEFAQTEQPAASPFSFDDFESSAEQGLPDWFSAGAEEENTAEAAEQLLEEGSFASPFTTESEETEADWFAQASAEQTAAVSSEDALPDWLSQAGEGETAFGIRSSAGAVEAEETTAPSFFTPEEPPAWASNFQAEPAQEAPEAEASFAAFDMDQDAVPDWLSKIDAGGQVASSAVPAFVLDDEQGSPFGIDETFEEEPIQAGGAMPDWLSQMAEGQVLPPPGEALEQGQVPSGLAQADLPGWLEAMRPSDMSPLGMPFQDASDNRVESGGLLAGMRGVLQSEFTPEQVQKPSVYALKLQIPAEQQARVEKLKSLLEDEEQSRAVAAPAALPTSYILRLVIFVAFILAVIFALWAGDGTQTPVSFTEGVPAEVNDLHNLLSNLPAGEAVLISVDYEPGSIPELEAAASGVIQALVSKDNPLRLVSTSNSGPGLARHLLDQAGAEAAQADGVNIANLGYIPGGAAGLRYFAADPAGLMRYNLEAVESTSLDAWTAPLDPAQGMQNFSLILVLTDNANTVRSWVEQVGPQLQANQTPLVMIVSAQTEPIVRPYYQALPRQVQGFAAGVMGGVYLENLNSVQDGLALKYLDAYSLTSLVAAALLAIGSLVSFIAAQIAASKQLKSEGEV
jgi:hypothetical protein